MKLVVRVVVTDGFYIYTSVDDITAFLYSSFVLQIFTLIIILISKCIKFYTAPAVAQTMCSRPAMKPDYISMKHAKTGHASTLNPKVLQYKPNKVTDQLQLHCGLECETAHLVLEAVFTMLLSNKDHFTHTFKSSQCTSTLYFILTCKYEKLLSAPESNGSALKSY